MIKYLPCSKFERGKNLRIFKNFTNTFHLDHIINFFLDHPVYISIYFMISLSFSPHILVQINELEVIFHSAIYLLDFS